jgi:hypothetical protein
MCNRPTISTAITDPALAYACPNLVAIGAENPPFAMVHRPQHPDARVEQGTALEEQLR